MTVVKQLLPKTKICSFKQLDL